MACSGSRQCRSRPRQRSDLAVGMLAWDLATGHIRYACNIMWPSSRIQPGDTVVFGIREADRAGYAVRGARDAQFRSDSPAHRPGLCRGRRTGRCAGRRSRQPGAQRMGVERGHPRLRPARGRFPAPYLHHYALGDDCRFRDHIRIPYEPGSRRTASAARRSISRSARSSMRRTGSSRPICRSAFSLRSADCLRPLPSARKRGWRPMGGDQVTAIVMTGTRPSASARLPSRRKMGSGCAGSPTGAMPTRMRY